MSTNSKRIINILNSDKINEFSSVVLMGMAKSGTTLPLTLLDSHPDLFVMPEELTFFHLGYDSPDWKLAFKQFEEDNNLNLFKIDETDFKKYKEHNGRGFGKRNYTNINYEEFNENVREVFKSTSEPYKR